MSTPKRVYEGADPGQLLLEVWAEHGNEVKISEPERIRKGGLFGFFARTVYRIEVESTSIPAPPPAPGTTAPAGAIFASEPRVLIGMHTGTRGALESLIEETPDHLELSSPPPRSFGEILATVADSLGDDPSLFRAPRFVDEPTATSAPAPPPRPPRPPSPSAAPVTPAPVRPADAAAAQERTPPPTTSPSRAQHGALRDAMATWPFAQMRDESVPPVLDAPVGPPPARRVPTEPVILPVRDDATLEQLAALGFPPEVLDAVADPRIPHRDLEAVFGLLGPAPVLPCSAGALVAVVAPGPRALSTARALARAAGTDPHEVALVSRRRGARASRATPAAVPPTGSDTLPEDLHVHDAKQAADLAPGWRRDRVGIVALALPEARADYPWARAVLHALRPSATWLTVDARAKPEDIAELAAAIGGADALMVEHCKETATPAALLRAGIPVARLAGKPASPKAWATLATAALSQRREVGR